MSSAFIGLMSGTSCDGFDIVAAEFEPRIKLLAQQSFDYEDSVKDKLLRIIHDGHASLTDLASLDQHLAILYSDAIRKVISTVQSTHVYSSHAYSSHAHSSIKLVAFHGPTIIHKPNASPGFSWQLGNAWLLCQLLKTDVACQFRQTDILEGGQGAPLAGIFHQAICKQDGFQQALFINLGGIANLSYINGDQVIAFDAGPANTLMDYWVSKHGLNSVGYDAGGQIASTGRVSEPHLKACLKEAYFSQAFPKSTGQDLFNLTWLEQQWCSLPKLSHEDTLATLSKLTAKAIALAYQHIMQTQYEEIGIAGSEESRLPVFLIGGGINNKTLVRHVQTELNTIVENILQSEHDPLPFIHKLNFRPPSIDAKYMEATCWAYLAYLLDANLGVDLSLSTGNMSNCVLGQRLYAAKI